ncbi:MAG: amidohydrolase family protein [Kofleriaceae bacterium]
MRTLARVLLVGCVGCGSSPPPPAPPPATPPTTPPPAATPAAPTTEHWVESFEGRKVGQLDITDHHDGTFAIVYDHRDNGRGPHVEATLALAADGTPTKLDASGHHEMGAKSHESFAIENGRAHWSSGQEHGEAPAGKGPVFFDWISEATDVPWLVPAALRHGGTIDVWPSGTATVEKVEDATAGSTAITLYSVSGLSIDPFYVWFAGDKYFGQTYTGFSTLHEQDLSSADALAEKVETARRKKGEDLARTSAHKIASEGFAYLHARVFDAPNGKWLDNQTVLVVDDKIKAIGPNVKVPLGAESIDLAGKSLLPGLVDMHSHTDRTGALLDIASGVTTVRDVGNDPDDLDLMKKQFDEGSLIGPHIVRMGFIEGRNEKAASSKVTAETPEEAHAAVELFAKRGYDGIKIYNSVPVKLVPILAADAHKRGMLVVGHIPVHMLAHEAIDAGYDGIEHINMLFLNFFATHDTDTRDTTRFSLVGEHATELDLDGKPVAEFIKQMQTKHTIIDPTLGAFEGLFVATQGEVMPSWRTLVSRLPSNAQRQFLAGGLPLTPELHQKYLQAWTRLLAMVKKLYDSHVTIVAGTDTDPSGLSLHHELELLVAAGLTPTQVLQATTIVSARAMKQDKVMGSITVGKRADLVVVDGDPSTDIKQIRKVVSTMRSGVIYDAATLYKAKSVQP